MKKTLALCGAVMLGTALLAAPPAARPGQGDRNARPGAPAPRHAVKPAPRPAVKPAPRPAVKPAPRHAVKPAPRRPHHAPPPPPRPWWKFW